MDLTRVRAGGALLAVTAAAAAGLTACGTGPASRSGLASASAGDISLTDGWATETTGSVGGAYFTLADDSDRPDALVSATTPAAERTELHTSAPTGDGSAGTMRQVARIPVPAGGSTRLQTGGYHLMLVAPTRSLAVGEEVPVRLGFASGTTIEVRLPVIDRADRPR